MALMNLMIWLDGSAHIHSPSELQSNTVKCWYFNCHRLLTTAMMWLVFSRLLENLNSSSLKFKKDISETNLINKSRGKQREQFFVCWISLKCCASAKEKFHLSALLRLKNGEHTKNKTKTCTWIKEIRSSAIICKRCEAYTLHSTGT